MLPQANLVSHDNERALNRRRSGLNDYLEVRLEERSAQRCLVLVHDGGTCIGELWYEALAPVVRPFTGTTMDFATLALLPYAMHQHKHLSIVGPVTRSLLEHLEEYQDAWVKWCPDFFARAHIFAGTILDAPARPHAGESYGAVQAFSGGLDSIYSLIANQTRALGLRSRSIATLALTHGFDIPLREVGAFEAASAKAARIGAAFGVPLQRIRTNWRAWSPQWLMTFVMGLSSVLQMFSGDHDAAIISSDLPYSTQVLPVSDNPVTNRFMSSREFPLLTVGFGATRTEKARLVGQHAIARELVRVCWAGGDLSRNCGHCEKCLRTKLNFLAAGIGVIPALGELDIAEVEALKTHTPGQVRLLEEILSAQPGLPPEYQAALAPVVARERAIHLPHG